MKYHTTICITCDNWWWILTRQVNEIQKKLFFSILFAKYLSQSSWKAKKICCILCKNPPTMIPEVKNYLESSQIMMSDFQICLLSKRVNSEWSCQICWYEDKTPSDFLGQSAKCLEAFLTSRQFLKNLWKSSEIF